MYQYVLKLVYPCYTYKLSLCLLKGVSELPDIRFIGNASTVTEAEGTVTVCAVSGQLADEVIPVNVTISTVSNKATGKLYNVGV